MKKLLFCLLGIVFALSTIAQTVPNVTRKGKKERNVTLIGEVYDSFTKAKLGAHITLMAADSTVIDTMTCWTWGTNSYYQFKIPAVQQDLIIKGSLDGYEDAYLNYELRYLARNRFFELPRMLMKKKAQEDIWREDSLGGVVVRGTKVKIAYRGDTIVYNASAFNMPEGSMLDGLIRQMPGAEIKSNGDIYINGEKIDYLTLNGKDFFKGQNKVMLDNLPYYTIQNIKVFHQSTKQSKLLGKDIERKEYVMDVNLKREYHRGYMGNVEVGAGAPLLKEGTHDARYLARLFGLYYTDHSRYTVYGNLNNINENRTPGGEGEWSPSNMPQGLQKTKQAGFDFSTEDADKNFQEEGHVNVQWSDALNETRTTAETFASEGSIFRGAWSSNRQKDVRMNIHNEFTLQKPFILFSRLSFNYADGRSTADSQDSTYRAAVTNRTFVNSLNKYRQLSGDAMVTLYKKLSWGDYYGISAMGSFSKNDPSDAFSRQITRYVTTGKEDLRHRYNDTHSDSYNWQVSALYNFSLFNNWNIRPRIAYQQSQQTNHDSNYRLDWLGNMTPRSLSWLPSTRDSLLSVIDTDNTSYTQHFMRNYQAEVSINKATDDYMLELLLPYQHSAERVRYKDASLDTIAHRHFNQLKPQLNFYMWKGGMKQIIYRLDIDQPELASLLPTDDTTNPLIIRVNNPELKKHIAHNITLRYSTNIDSLKRNFSSWADLRIERNNWGTRTLYNKDEGSYIFMNDNVNGNWSTSLGVSYSFPLDKQKLFVLDIETDASYNHNVDFDVQYFSSNDDSDDIPDHKVFSTVNNWQVHGHPQLRYQKEELTATLSGNITWRNSTGTRENFQRINSFDFDYGTSLNYTIPVVKIGVSTDLRMYSRRGYYSSIMNDNHLVWNAQLTRAFMKGKLTAKLQAFDLLHQLSSTQYSVNAQGRTETWQNCIPRYFMFSLMYKFTQRPKIKK